MGKKYTDSELRALRFLRQKYGHITYCEPAQLEAEFFALTGTHRSSGPLYMAAWRLEHGRYTLTPAIL
jgi:hypothetical protein